ncbi:MAG: GNAT family N-acetyltransferase [Acidimicrobiia bacterium]
MPEATITIRPFEDRDLPQTLEVMRLALGEPALLARTPELFAWKHLRNPFGRSLMLVAEAGGRIVGLRAFMRWELQTPGGAVLRCVRAVDTATHPDFQRRGIFRSLTTQALELAATEGIDLVFNTPNPRSGAGYLSMGWAEVGPIGVMVRPSAHMLLPPRALGGLPDPDDFPGGPLAGALEVADRPPRGLRTPRTPEYLAWRFSAHPTARYLPVETKGSVALTRPNLRRGRRELVLSDVLGTRAGAAIREVRKRSRSHYLVAWFSPGSPERRAALRNGLLPVPRVAPLRLYARPLRELEVDVTTPAAWDLALGDLELL